MIYQRKLYQTKLQKRFNAGALKAQAAHTRLLETSCLISVSVLSIFSKDRKKTQAHLPASTVPQLPKIRCRRRKAHHAASTVPQLPRPPQKSKRTLQPVQKASGHRSKKAQWPSTRSLSKFSDSRTPEWRRTTARPPPPPSLITSPIKLRGKAHVWL